METGVMKKVLVISAAALLLPYALGFAQGIVVPQSVLDSIANPPLERVAGLVFDRECFDLGEIRDDSEPVQVTFTLTNEGDSPISVQRISSSCGCTTALHDTAAVLPGASAEIRAFYNPRGQSGRQTRKIYVFTDRSAVHPAAALALKVNVVPGAVPAGFQVVMGHLACSRNVVRLSLEQGEEKTVERVAVRNLGKSPLRPKPVEGFCPEWLGFRCEPETVAPGADADMVLTLDRRKMPEGQTEGNAAVILDIPGVRPSQRTLNVSWSIVK